MVTKTSPSAIPHVTVLHVTVGKDPVSPACTNNRYATVGSFRDSRYLVATGAPTPGLVLNTAMEARVAIASSCRSSCLGMELGINTVHLPSGTTTGRGPNMTMPTPAARHVSRTSCCGVNTGTGRGVTLDPGVDVTRLAASSSCLRMWASCSFRAKSSAFCSMDSIADCDVIVERGGLGNVRLVCCTNPASPFLATSNGGAGVKPPKTFPAGGLGVGPDGVADLSADLGLGADAGFGLGAGLGVGVGLATDVEFSVATDVARDWADLAQSPPWARIAPAAEGGAFGLISRIDFGAAPVSSAS